MYQVLKRDKSIVPFNILKIADAIKKAFDAEKVNYEESTINLLALSVTADYQPKIRTAWKRFFPTRVTPMSPRRTFYTVNSVKRSVT